MPETLPDARCAKCKATEYGHKDHVHVEHCPFGDCGVFVPAPVTPPDPLPLYAQRCSGCGKRVAEFYDDESRFCEACWNTAAARHEATHKIPQDDCEACIEIGHNVPPETAPEPPAQVPTVRDLPCGKREIDDVRAMQSAPETAADTKGGDA